MQQKLQNKANTLLLVFQREWMFKKRGGEKYSQALKINKTLHSPSGIMCIHDGFFLFAAFTSYLQCLHFLFTAFTFLFAAFNFFLCSVFFLFAAIVCYSQRSLFYLQQFFFILSVHCFSLIIFKLSFLSLQFIVFIL